MQTSAKHFGLVVGP